MAEGVEEYDLERIRHSTAIFDAAELKKRFSEPVRKSEQNVTWWSRLTVEPVILGSMTAISLAQTSLQNLYLKSACQVDLQFPADVCHAGVGEDFRVAEIASQQVISQLNIIRGLVAAAISTFVLMFVGPWSDYSGRRKTVMILPLVGMSLTTINALLLTTFPGFSAVVVLYAIQLPMSFGGNFVLLLAASFSYVSDVCTSKKIDVTIAMGKCRAAMQFSSVLGASLGPIIYKFLGFYGVFTIVLLCQLLALSFVLFRVKDVNVNEDNRVPVFDWRLPVSAIKCLFQRRDGHKQSVLILMMVVAVIDRVLLNAAVQISFMFFRNKFHWNDIIYGSYIAYNNIVSLGGTMFILKVLKLKFRLSDESVGSLSCLVNSCAYVALILTTNTYFVFCIPAIAFISQGSMVVQRPILNNQIETDERGKLFSIMGALEQAFQMATAPLYSLLYAKTAKDFPAAFLIPGCILALIEALMYFVSNRLAKNQFEEEENIKIDGSRKVLTRESVAIQQIQTKKAVLREGKVEFVEMDQKNMSTEAGDAAVKKNANETQALINRLNNEIEQ